MKSGVSVPKDEPKRGPTPDRAAKSRLFGSRLRRRIVFVVAIFVVLGLVGWAVREPITAKLETVLLTHLHEQGVYPVYAQRSWLPWRGLRFESIVLHRDAALNHPVVELSELTVVFRWMELLRGHGMVSRWRMKDARLTLHDDAGAISFEHVTGSVQLRGEQLEIPKLRFDHNPVSWTLTGHILLGASADQNPASKTFSVDLTVIRAVLARLAFRPARGHFVIQGTISMDFRAADVVWQANLNGTGKAVEWEGIPFREAAVQAQASTKGIQLTANLQLTSGSAKISASRTDWENSPLIIAGQLADLAGKVDVLSGSFDHASEGLTIATLHGPVNLLEFARNFPALSPFVPIGIRFRVFPEVMLKDIRWFPSATPPTWSIGSVEVQSPANLAMTIGDRTLAIDHLQGAATCQDHAWRIQATAGRVAWGDVTAREAKLDGSLTPAQVSLNAKLGLAKGSIDLTVSRETVRPLSFPFKGTLADGAGLVDRFSGRYDAGSQSTVVTELEGKANLLEFASNFHAATQLPDGLQVRTFPDVLVKDFAYQAGPKPEIRSIGSWQIRSAADLTVRMKGRSLAIDRLIGSGSFDGKEWRLSKINGQALGGRFSLDGLYEGGTLRQSTVVLTKIRLEQVGPWIDAPQASLGDGLLSLEYRGVLGGEPAQLTGSGSVQLENTPLVKVPLLDQTYDLFSALLPGVKRADRGDLKATFSTASGVVTISDFTANGDAVTVTAKGKVDLVRRDVSAHAWGNLRGVAGVATLAVSRTLEMEVSGPLDQIRVRPVGAAKVVGGTISGAAKLLETGVALPFKAFEWLKSDPPKR